MPDLFYSLHTSKIINFTSDYIQSSTPQVSLSDPATTDGIMSYVLATSCRRPSYVCTTDLVNNVGSKKYGEDYSDRALSSANHSSNDLSNIFGTAATL